MYILELANDSYNIFIAGDYNEKYSNVRKYITDTPYILPYFGRTYNKKSIDQIVFLHKDLVRYKTMMIDKEDVSDHNGIVLDLFLE